VASNSWLDRWIEACARLTRPDRIEWCTGSEEEYDSLAHRMLQDGTLIELNQKAYPNCYLHRSRSNDVARTEHLTSLGRSSRRSNFCHCLGKPAIQSCASRRFLKNPILKEGLNRQGAKNTKRFLEF
jgi:GTP-dependent phosphoenolpyruvate carboxykinase